MKVEFRECDFFDLWIWLEFTTIPSEAERQYVEEVFNSWFLLGKLGGFNAENLQVQETGLEISYMEYSQETAEGSFMALMHNMSEFEYESNWGRCWFDIGTADAIALDVLINALDQLNKDYVTIERLIIGGENADWRIPGSKKASFVERDTENNYN
ncbi:DUF3531 family protein [Phormidium tenue FACHB-886]|nr:DUF3531 family protein [Phormidium tenue FACHB-886]